MAPQSDGANFSRSPWKTVLQTLLLGKMGTPRLMPTGSNYTFLVPISKGPGEECLAVYKPQKGETPLWDFPDGTLYQREYASYLVSQFLGWGFIPPTVIREGHHGVGTVQLFVEPEGNSHYFTLRGSHPVECQRIAVFDYLVNNADRKASHCFKGKDDNIWSVDHGLTFHTDYKLRTVIWDWAGEPIPQEIVNDLRRLSNRLDELQGILTPYLTRMEIQVLRRRLDRLIESPVFPQPGYGRNTPWPIF